MMEKILKNKILISLFVGVLLLVGILVYSSRDIKMTSPIEDSYSETNKVPEIIGKIKSMNVLVDKKYECTETANVLWTECIIDKLDYASAEREWKQRKIEGLTSKEVNEEYLIPELKDELVKIRNWREGFEKSRDDFCEANSAFVSGSGTPGGRASCKLDIELEAIHLLNYLYYDSIIDFNQSTGITDFEPTEEDINNLVKTNITTTKCGWTGEDECL